MTNIENRNKIHIITSSSNRFENPRKYKNSWVTALLNISSLVVMIDSRLISSSFSEIFAILRRLLVNHVINQWQLLAPMIYVRIWYLLDFVQ